MNGNAIEARLDAIENVLSTIAQALLMDPTPSGGLAAGLRYYLRDNAIPQEARAIYQRLLKDMAEPLDDPPRT